MNAYKLARALGWFSIGLGLIEAFAPRRFGRYLGVQRTDIVRAFGLREMTTGVGLLAGRNKSRWARGRVAGDLIDLAALGQAFRARQVERQRLASAIGGVALCTLIDAMSARRMREASAY